MLYGIFDEFVQRCMHNGRTFQWADVSRDVLGVVIGSGFALIIAGFLWLLKRRRV
jgi:VanZ family protein